MFIKIALGIAASLLAGKLVADALNNYVKQQKAAS